MGHCRRRIAPPPKTRVEFWRDPALPYLVDARTTHLADDAFHLHTHDCLMLSLVEAGSTRLRLRNGLHPVPAGAVVVVPPGEPHACNPVPGEALQYKALFLRAEWIASPQAERLVSGPGMVLWPAAGGQGNVAQAQTHTPAHTPAQTLARAYAAFRGPGDRLEKDEAFHELLAVLSRACGGVAPLATPAPLPSAHVGTVQAHLMAHLGRVVTLDELAALTATQAQAGVSPYQLLRGFQRQVGLSPHAWQMQRRLELAKTLLAQGLPPAQVALETGFSDQSHFHRVFKRHVAATPGQYQAGGRCKIVQAGASSCLA
ncbi:AraC family transcriptional regulator [Megalodesulfovibrio gigas]|uniref:Putative AraC type helix-turn-helix-domain-containing protein n=1 Tax=Megalodesulfovibrio gigas (strain ATCC 19364 / DSM 1382 / NCIMB 9332 / VKM B-1759) TaxID=1121448 RepID=T2G935_MEGG1|nr:AraC family transcriptional regulator [Megalodesulfovibrio gigas]AGW12684.1 putative AraC type helix-turn-helix- domain-containing protein [Megalodesulfovibrio gigas DSM 1382 = ATCC 19364]